MNKNGGPKSRWTVPLRNRKTKLSLPKMSNYKNPFRKFFWKSSKKSYFFPEIFAKFLISCFAKLRKFRPNFDFAFCEIRGKFCEIRNCENENFRSHPPTYKKNKTMDQTFIRKNSWVKIQTQRKKCSITAWGWAAAASAAASTRPTAAASASASTRRTATASAIAGKIILPTRRQLTNQ